MTRAGGKSYSKQDVLERFRASRKTREGEQRWLAYLLDSLAVLLLLADRGLQSGLYSIASTGLLDNTIVLLLIVVMAPLAVLVFIASRLASQVPTWVGWGFLVLLALLWIFPIVMHHLSGVL